MFVNQLSVFDYAYLDRMQGLIGDARYAAVRFIGQLNEEGVVFDFSLAKNAAKKIIDEIADHRVIVPSSCVEWLNDGDIQIKWDYSDGEWLCYKAPAQAIVALNTPAVTIGAIEAYLAQEIMKGMPENINGVEVSLVGEELPPGKAIYHYTHGLKEHYGNCQRLFHGHRNTIDIMVDGVRDNHFEKLMAERLQNKHLIFKENVKKVYANEGVSRIQVEYQSGQGYFFADLPFHMVEIFPYETTVENISRFVCNQVKVKFGNLRDFRSVQVNAYEGIQKGATTSISRPISQIKDDSYTLKSFVKEGYAEKRGSPKGGPEITLED